jgi:hypothetical protein
VAADGFQSASLYEPRLAVTVVTMLASSSHLLALPTITNLWIYTALMCDAQGNFDGKKEG